MSQIAQAYIVSAGNLPLLAGFVRVGDWKNFWQSLDNSGVAVIPEYEYSAYVISVLLAFWEEKNIGLPMNLSHPCLKSIADSQAGLALCADRVDATNILGVLQTQSTSELERYFAEFSGEDWEEAETAMQQAWQFIARGLALVRREDEYYILLVG